MRNMGASPDGSSHPLLSSSSLSSCWYSREDGWWMVVMMARPPAASLRRDVSRCIAVVESRPLQRKASSQ